MPCAQLFYHMLLCNKLNDICVEVACYGRLPQQLQAWNTEMDSFIWNVRCRLACVLKVTLPHAMRTQRCFCAHCLCYSVNVVQTNGSMKQEVIEISKPSAARKTWLLFASSQLILAISSPVWSIGRPAASPAYHSPGPSWVGEETVEHTSK